MNDKNILINYPINAYYLAYAEDGDFYVYLVKYKINNFG